MSRDIKDLRQSVAAKARQHIALCEREGIDLLIYSTLRTPEEQAVLFRQGRSLAEIEKRAEELRTEYGRPDLQRVLLDAPPQYEDKIVTHAAPGQSLHNYGLAYDCVPQRNGEAIWDNDDLWKIVGLLGKNIGLSWGGDWDFPDKPHFYRFNATWRQLIRSK